MNHWSRTGAEETGRAGDVPPEGCTSRFANVDSRAEETGAGGEGPAGSPRSISITMEIYTMVPDRTTLAALKRLSDALGSPDATLPARC
jgi:hypothetical protein